MPVFQSIFLQGIWKIIYFPIWWYTKGLVKRIFDFSSGVFRLAHDLSLKIMVTHLFSPMFGETTKSGRIISFFMRIILLAWLLFLFILGTIGLFILLILWIVLPIVAVMEIISLLSVA
ncbi:MAG: hypothetical protein PHE59_03360 [Patescibacteria group bacterium]|nr:hypothetical protein [Patescibacteria group bacterium]MDD5164463.1 hypothetical protein [Patescibacteria group bacterium]MDD5534382.1 hypothetical protein [Patescibacteria group bacterium]